MNRKSIIIISGVVIAAASLIMFAVTREGFLWLFSIFVFWVLFVILTIRPIARFSHKLLTGKVLTNQQLGRLLLRDFLLLLVIGLFAFLNISYPTTRPGYLFRGLSVIALMFFFYIIYVHTVKKRKKRESKQ